MAKEQRLDISWEDTFRPIGGLTSGARNVISIKKEIIPIILVPGVMGTRLKQKGQREKVWDPDDPLFMLRHFGYPWVNAKRRQRFILGEQATYRDDVEPDEGDVDHNVDCFEEAYPGATLRGWGGVMWESYGPILTDLQNASWPPDVQRCLRLPVYACGYDWRGPAEVAGKRLVERVREIATSYRASAMPSSRRVRSRLTRRRHRIEGPVRSALDARLSLAESPDASGAHRLLVLKSEERLSTVTWCRGPSFA